MNILFTNAHPYLKVHEAFRLETLDAWAREYGFIVYARITPKTDPSLFNEIRHLLTNTHFSPPYLSDDELANDMNAFIREINPDKVINNLEIFIPWDRIDTTAEKVYFMRSCSAKLLQVIMTYDDDSLEFHNAVSNYNEYVEREIKFIKHSDSFITDSPNSISAMREMYPDIQDIQLCLEYVNPTKYLDVPISATFSNEAYFVGRLDFQKGLKFVESDTSVTLYVIGDSEVNGLCSANNGFIHLGVLPFEEYISHISHCNFGVFPSIWESNGYTVQECLAMGKLPIIQRGSGGNERLVVHEVNGFVIDFKTESWSDIVKYTPKDKIIEMRNNAKLTLTHEMYKDSLNKFSEIITR